MPKPITVQPKIIAKEINQAVDTLVVYIIDQSGSMYPSKTQVISGFNEYLNDLKRQLMAAPEKGAINMSVILFNSYVTVSPFRSVARRDDFTTDDYTPSGNTALYDAIGFGIKEMDHALAENEGSNAVIVIQTDGQENSSGSYDQGRIKRLISDRTEQGWTFSFMGVDLDAYAASSAIGIGRGNTISTSRENTGDGIRSASVGTQSIRDISYSTGARGSSQSFYDIARKTVPENIVDATVNELADETLDSDDD